MNRIVQAEAMILVAYFMSLPFLFVAHALEHDHLDANSNTQTFDFEIVQNSNECSLCDLYQNQSAELQPFPAFESGFILLSVTEVIQSGPLLKEYKFSYLRGPPAI